MSRLRNSLAWYVLVWRKKTKQTCAIVSPLPSKLIFATLVWWFDRAFCIPYTYISYTWFTRYLVPGILYTWYALNLIYCINRDQWQIRAPSNHAFFSWYRITDGKSIAQQYVVTTAWLDHKVTTKCPQSAHEVSTKCPQSAHRVSTEWPQSNHETAHFPNLELLFRWESSSILLFTVYRYFPI